MQNKFDLPTSIPIKPVLVPATQAKPAGRHPKLVGDIAQAKVLAALVGVYDNVLMPFGENSRYDFVVEDGDRFLRIQCKSGRLRNGAILFAACSSNYHHPNNQGTKLYQHPYRGQADLFSVYCPDTEAVYLIPVDDVGMRRVALRVTPPRNNQAKKIRWAKDFEI